MLKKILIWGVGVPGAIVVVLAVVVTGILLSRQPGLDVIPGGRLSREEIMDPVTDWNFMKQHPIVTLEVRALDPYSVNTSCFLHNGVLYVRSSPRFPLKQIRQVTWGSGESRWAQLLLQDPDMRLRVADKIYRVRATSVEDPALVREIYDNQVRDRGGGLDTGRGRSDFVFSARLTLALWPGLGRGGYLVRTNLAAFEMSLLANWIGFGLTTTSS